MMTAVLSRPNTADDRQRSKFIFTMRLAMAKFLSQVYTQIRGSVGGIPYLTTPAGAMIARARVIPVNAPSPFRTIVKSALIEAVSRWSALTVAGQAAWNTWALAHPPGDGRQQLIAGQALQGLGDISALPGSPALMTATRPAPTRRRPEWGLDDHHQLA